MSARDRQRTNRQNAQHSTGPKSEDGKAKSRFNALKDGFRATIQVLPGESHKEFNALANAYLDDYQPQTQIERRFVAKLIDAEWRDRRLAKQEREAWLSASTLPNRKPWPSVTSAAPTACTGPPRAPSATCKPCTAAWSAKHKNPQNEAKLKSQSKKTNPNPNPNPSRRKNIWTA